MKIMIMIMIIFTNISSLIMIVIKVFIISLIGVVPLGAYAEFLFTDQRTFSAPDLVRFDP